LPAPEPSEPTAEFRAPVTATEIALAHIWSEVLRVERVGLDDDFFSLGGDSIHLFQITARANQSGFRLAAKDLLRNSTLAALARRLDETARTAHETSGPRQSADVSQLRPDQGRQREAALRAGEHS
jgi:aryl carrier-like protein